MKIKIHQSDLNKALNIVEKSLSSKSVIESLKGIKITVTETDIIFLTSKSEIAIEYKMGLNDIDIEVEEIGEVIVPGFHFINIIRKMNSNYIKLEQVGNKLNIYANKSHIELIGFDKNTYPHISFELTESKSFEMEKALLKESYNKTKYVISQNPINQILTGINFNFKDNFLKVYATDSLRMTYFKKEYNLNDDFSFTINKNLLSDINRILDNSNEEKFQLSFNDNQCLIKNTNVKIKVRLLDGNFPNIEKIIPNDISFSYDINKENLLESLHRIVLLTERNESVVQAKIEGSELQLVSSHKFLGTIEENFNIKNLKGSGFPIAFDPYFIIDAVATIEEEEVSLQFIDEISGFIIKNPSNDKIINVISPIRLS